VINQIRPLAVALCRSGDRILVERGHDRVRVHRFYRAIGGGIEFGEAAATALAREWKEEYGLTLEHPVLLGVVENLFTFEGHAGHEIVLVFTARIVESYAYDRHELEGTDENGVQHIAVWVALDTLRTGTIPFYPAGALELPGGEQSFMGS
jgi:ADP-ribose pyrophosphatase YjhB (NUDIX family)